ncbi:uncharacterized protein EDB93DRAFT_1175132 [Suillus bovinus]|uniref:uncharacterized protein n=1 Tax=Suillus bovinus TaxID=48563 RepID=UPI001B85BA85|nr:uncharacterized protein EDB93DRAFT_1179121 [Suillus bovinus]XP_041303099.1 uncharacterized protein EDB93DRAFT_1175132 [Suillus bovinus]KAG2130836.1 hypothetical protein EDB93DRAFT_1179121 [Suillus bovinus]KAG2133276.1 hypothetical protein EDB93DRAFT_1175132 [Suillus bovinus]
MVSSRKGRLTVSPLYIRLMVVGTINASPTKISMWCECESMRSQLTALQFPILARLKLYGKSTLWSPVGFYCFMRVFQTCEGIERLNPVSASLL